MIDANVTSPTEAPQPLIRVVIAEDQALVRRGAALLLSMESDMEVVGQACNGVEAVELTHLLRPDVVLMDLHMPLKGGVVATREITYARERTPICSKTPRKTSCWKQSDR
jgi:DNA-binding NarL/FixJ family response regulator